MRILSNFKDYYDFPNFGYDTDTTIVYNRKIETFSRPLDDRIPKIHREGIEAKDYPLIGLDESNHPKYGYRHWLVPHLLYICDVCYLIYIYDKTPVTEAYDFFTSMANKELRYRPLKIATTLNSFNHTAERKKNRTYDPRDITGRILENMPRLNTEFNTPILLVRLDLNLRHMVFTTNPSLMALGFDKISIEQIYQEIELFVGKSKDIPSPPVPDINKIENKGFDKKTSFRHPIK